VEAVTLRPGSLLAELPPEARAGLLDRGRRRPVVADEVIVRQGEAGTEMFVIVSGTFRVTVGGGELGICRELRVLGPGDCFGEIALLAGSARSATVTAAEPGELVAVSADDFRRLAAEEPAFMLAICRVVARRLESLAMADRHARLVHPEDFPDAARHTLMLPPRVTSFCQAVVLEAAADHAVVALVDPYDAPRRTLVTDLLRGRRVEIVAIAEEAFARFAGLHLNARPAADDGGMFQPEVSVVDPQGLRQDLGGEPTAERLAAALRQAVAGGASDMHVEPGETGGRIRIRLDGRLVPIAESIDPREYERLVSRLKVMAQIDIAERRRPQDGRFAIEVGDRRLDVRVSTMPCVTGEKVVLRLLDAELGRRRLRDLVFSKPLCDRLEEVFAAPSGLILVCGPTGSGKTTTLYAGLDEIWRAASTVNIVTLEDPVEYRLPYAVQVQVDASLGRSFADLLRTVLRQDPDVVLVGEIRDGESAEIAAEAASTGHLVLSSLHTNSALEAIARLRQLGVRPFLASATLRCIISQHLVPRVCRACAEPASDEPTIQRLVARGIITEADRGRLVAGAGCAACRGRGESGRVGVYEVLLVDGPVRELIEQEATAAEMAAALHADNFLSLERYCRFLLLEGVIAPHHVGDCVPLHEGLRLGV
jgi:general secretion pathway protein E